MSARPYLPCREIITFLADYLDGQLPPDTLAEFERHLAACHSCVAYLESYRVTIRAARAVSRFEEEIVEDAPEDLIKAILRSTT